MKKVFDYFMPQACKNDFEKVRLQAAQARQNVLDLFANHGDKIIKEISTPTGQAHG